MDIIFMADNASGLNKVNSAPDLWNEKAFCFQRPSFIAKVLQTVWKVASIGFLCGLRRARI
jgi:hypothetical protein